MQLRKATAADIRQVHKLIKQECVYCDKFGACKEIPMIQYLVPMEQVDESPFPSLPPAEDSVRSRACEGS